MRCRSLRRSRFRTTAEPTFLLTTNPTSGGAGSSRRTSRWPVTSGRPARLPARVAAVKSTPRRIRAPAGSMTTPASRGSDANALAALPATCRQDGAARPSAHAQPEAMRLRPAAIVRLECALAHRVSRCVKSVVNAVAINGSHHYTARADPASDQPVGHRHPSLPTTADTGLHPLTGLIHLTGPPASGRSSTAPG